MPSWNQLLTELESQASDQNKQSWLVNGFNAALASVGSGRGDRNVIFYGSAFLQKPTANQFSLSITSEDVNGFMSVMHGMDWSRNLTLVLHTPGGVTNATETLVAYLHSKFPDIEVIVPTFAMSAGTMISLASNRIVMGRQSQLGPIDPQMPFNGRPVSAQAIIHQFERAKAEILADAKTAHVWAPINQWLGPALLQEAQMASEYSEEMVRRWLAERMFAGHLRRRSMARSTAAHFNSAAAHKSHGRRIDRVEARNYNLVVEDLEADQSLQEAVLTAYHLATMIFEKSPAVKMVWSTTGNQWIKNAGTA
jgi:hypothetical protein